MAAITTYSTLKSAIKEYLRRDGGTTLDSQIDTFIDLAEAEFNRKLRCYQMEEETTLTTDANGDATLPSDFLAVRSARRVGSPNIELEAVSMGTENRLSPYDTAGVARYYSISGTTFRVTPIEASLDVTLTYYEYIPALTSLSAQNWLLLLAPDAYLYMSLKHALIFLGEADKAAALGGVAESILREMGILDDLARYMNAEITLDGTIV